MMHGWQSEPTDGPTGGWRCRVVCRVSCVVRRVSCLVSRVSCLVSRVLLSRVSCLVFSRLVSRVSYVSCRVVSCVVYG